MKVLAIDSSPDKDDCITAMLLDPYLEGMREAGAEVELYYGRDLVIFPCCGNLNCTVGTPGRCMAYDDMRWLRPKISLADVLVLASPLYFNGIAGPAGTTAAVKSLMGRLVPGARPCPQRRYEHAVHTTQEQVNIRKVVFVSGCGFLEIDGLYPMLTHIKSFCNNTYPGFEGNFLEPRGVILKGELKDGASRDEVYAVAHDAGLRLALDNKISSMSRNEPVHPGSLPAAKPLKKREWDNVILYRF